MKDGQIQFERKLRNKTQEILNFNKDMEEGKLYLSNMGLMKLEFKTDDTVSEYFLIRKAETSY